MKTELFLLLLILAISINAFPYLRKLDDESKTEAECKQDGKVLEVVRKAKCQVGEYSYDVESKDQCKKGTWTKAHCSTTKVIFEDDCNGTPTYTPATTDPASNAKCTLEINGEDREIDDGDRLLSSEKCQIALFWTEGSCSETTVIKEGICEATTDPTFTEATGKCVDKKSDSEKSSSSSSFNSFLSFKFGLVLITYLLF